MENLERNFTEEKNAEFLRIAINNDVMKKIQVIASIKDINGKKQEVTSQIVEMAVNFLYKEKIVKELQSLGEN
ncbi:MAG: hypothetical protein EOM50_10560 [Erysipelotrichia bacterium]|nr:hypothetical protein [Erysipelotrichia bacterium]